MCHGKLGRPSLLGESGWQWIRLHGAQKTGSQEEDAERDASALQGGREGRMVVQEDEKYKAGVVRGVHRRAGRRLRLRRRRGRRGSVGVGAGFV